MEIKTSISNEIFLVKLFGDLNGYDSGDEFKKCLDEAIKQSITKVAIDFSECGRADSTGIGTLIMAYKKLQQKNGEVVLLCLNDFLQDIVSITKLDGVFKIFNSYKEAEEYFSAK